MAEIRKEFTNFLNDLDKNIKNQEDLKYMKERSAMFMNVILDHIDFILQLKEDKISEIEEKQNIIQNKLNGIEKDIAEIQQEMYIDDIQDFEEYDELNSENSEQVSDDYMINEEDEECDFEIVCPYCESEFLIDINQEETEIKCPECNNIIELDWTGNVDDDSNNTQIQNCGYNHCSKCPGCGNKSIDKKDEDDDM